MKRDREMEDLKNEVAELAAKIEALEILVGRQIFRLDFFLRRHAAEIADSIEESAAEMPRIPPNELLIENLRRLAGRIRSAEAELRRVEREEETPS